MAETIGDGYMVTPAAPTITSLLGVEMSDADGAPIREVGGVIAET